MNYLVNSEMHEEIDGRETDIPPLCTLWALW